MGGARPRTGRLAALASVLLLAACSGGGSDGGAPTSASVAPAAAPERPPEASYAVPDPLPPGPPGALIRATPIAGVPVLPATDYQGLGTPGPARSAIGLSAGRAVLDVARAARGLQAAGAGGRVVLAGHSVGGHAVLWAAELARSYAPELQVLGVATSAPGAELAAGLKAEGSSGPATLTSGAMLLVVAWSDAYRVSLDVLTPAGRKAVDRVRTHCLLELAAGPATPVVRPGDLLTTPPWPALLARNTPGHAATRAPIFLAQGADDDRVTPAVTRVLVQRLCRLGDTVELRTYQHVGHFDLPEAAGTDVAVWIGGRLAGRPARSTCRR